MFTHSSGLEYAIWHMTYCKPDECVNKHVSNICLLVLVLFVLGIKLGIDR